MCKFGDDVDFDFPSRIVVVDHRLDEAGEGIPTFGFYHLAIYCRRF
jgi:hypothetical protein